MSLVATLEALVEAGATPEMMLAVVRRHEAEAEKARQERREKDAERQRQHRAQKQECHAPSRDVTVTGRDSRGPSPHVGAGAQVVVTSLPSLRSEEVGGGGGVERERASDFDDWPDGKASDHAQQLVDAVSSPWLDPQKSPDLVTTRGRLAAWRREGASWEHDVLPVVTALCSNRRGRISSWKFFDNAVARSIADNRAALEIPEAGARMSIPPANDLTTRIAAEHAEARRRVMEG